MPLQALKRSFTGPPQDADPVHLTASDRVWRSFVASFFRVDFCMRFFSDFFGSDFLRDILCVAIFQRFFPFVDFQI